MGVRLPTLQLIPSLSCVCWRKERGCLNHTMLHAVKKCEQLKYCLVMYNKLHSFNRVHSYMMMMKCWEMMAEDRPSFKELHKKTSKYIERIAGYLEMGFNPFTGMGFTMAEEVQSSVDKMNKVEEEQEMAPPVVTQDTPRSGEISAENNIFTNTAD